MRIQRIMLATDFSPQARVALDYAVELSKRLEVPLLLLAAFQIPIYPLPEGVMLRTTETISQLLAQTSSDLATARQVATDLGARDVETVVIEGSPAAEIVRIAAERKVDIIVMGSHGRGGISRAILGSVADKVMRTAHCPVMIVAHGV
ncbi:MAG TPA: universal stress protein [Kofleriaceae bacterium]|nr:universal stress protein [Kofleriaceae bacterium]